VRAKQAGDRCSWRRGATSLARSNVRLGDFDTADRTTTMAAKRSMPKAMHRARSIKKHHGGRYRKGHIQSNIPVASITDPGVHRLHRHDQPQPDATSNCFRATLAPWRAGQDWPFFSIVGDRMTRPMRACDGRIRPRGRAQGPDRLPATAVARLSSPEAAPHSSRGNKVAPLPSSAFAAAASGAGRSPLWQRDRHQGRDGRGHRNKHWRRSWRPSAASPRATTV